MDAGRATRVAALILGLTALASPSPAAAAPTDLPEATTHAGRLLMVGHVARPSTGTDRPAGARAAKEARAERDVALAATWHLDPALLRPAPADSEATAAARQQLAMVDAHLGEVLKTYEKAHAAADDATARARDAHDALVAAKQAAKVAAARYRADRELMMSVVTEAYTTSQLGAFGLLLSADSDEDLVQGVTVLQEMGRTQSDAVVAAEQSRDRLREATVAVAEADRDARETLVSSRAALAAAEQARARVLADVRTARHLLEDSVLADQALRETTAGGYDGALSFPLPPGTSFVDQHNWGHRSRHWASVHTGDDFSTACGTPVLAVNDGTVAIRTDQGWSGPWLVMVGAGDGGLTTWYAHMQALLVSSGQPVVAGQQIGVVGQAGNATGCHLHLEVHPSGGSIYQDDTDPSRWLDTVGVHAG
ncbi:hypothetical protein GCM10009844_40990 [Nocardioides koreensis]|uniref:M23ase beta-sheet core domain-containing protein n=1 Tax=Nocardioides koreensis TaxID=433651 RepID=A0ABN3A665_9ACTN